MLEFDFSERSKNRDYNLSKEQVKSLKDYSNRLKNIDKAQNYIKSNLKQNLKTKLITEPDSVDKAFDHFGDSTGLKKFDLLDLNRNGRIDAGDFLKLGLGVAGAAAIGALGKKAYKNYKLKQFNMSETKSSLGRTLASLILGG